ncbi:fumarate hydratase class II [Nitrospirota bacterium]|nr:fumarate hydratase class II [Nitrospirota bacterium]
MKKTRTPSPPATRIERDTMGELAVPATAYYGVQTARAIENFPISSLRFPRAMIRAMGMIKRAAATVNQSLGLLDKKPANAITKAATEVIDGHLDAEFPWISSKPAPAPRRT